MAGCVFSYGLVGLLTAEKSLLSPEIAIGLLVVSRVIVGLVKQTMTLSTALAADLTPETDRAAAVAHISAAVMLGWTMGQGVGGTISELVSPSAPAALSVMLFVLDFLFVATALPGGTGTTNQKLKAKEEEEPTSHPGGGKASGARGKWAQILMLFSSRSLMQMVLLKCLVQLVARAWGSMETFYVAERFGLTPGELGRLGALQGLLNLLMQLSGVALLVKRYGEKSVVVTCLGCSAVVMFFESMAISVPLTPTPTALQLAL